MREVVAGEGEELWGNFETHGGAIFRLTAAQFLVGQPCCNHFHNQSLSVLPDAAWMDDARNADILVLNTGEMLTRWAPAAAFSVWPCGHRPSCKDIRIVLPCKIPLQQD